MASDIPDFTNHEVRALIYIHETQIQKNDEEKPPTITELADRTEWESKYYTRAWKRLQPKGLVNRVRDGNNTRLELTDSGSQVASLFMEINEVLEQR